MAIYLVTAPPGSGKTLYTVSALIPDLMKPVTKPDGSMLKRRLVICGIPDLLLDHVKLNTPIPEHQFSQQVIEARKKGEPIPDRGEFQGVWNWFDWSQSGDLIVIDEAQRHWRPRAAGSPVPREISELETHRHRGIDFVIITQHPMLIDQNVRRLVSPHIKVERVFGLNKAMVYEWQSCEISENGKTASKRFFSYPKKAFSLYKSAEVHTKQRRSIPAWLWFPVLAFVMGVFIFPPAFRLLTGAASGKSPISHSPTPGSPASSSRPVPAPAPIAQLREGFMPAALPAQEHPYVQTLAQATGCLASKSGCTCYGQQAQRLVVPDNICRDAASGQGYLKAIPIPDQPQVTVRDANPANITPLNQPFPQSQLPQQQPSSPRQFSIVTG